MLKRAAVAPLAALLLLTATSADAGWQRSRAAGATHGQALDAQAFDAVARAAGRYAVQRTTLYERIDALAG